MPDIAITLLRVDAASAFNRTSHIYKLSFRQKRSLNFINSLPLHL
nr:hypothetical protein [Nostoc sp. EkiNYC01]